MHIPTHYVTYAHLGPLGLSHVCEPADFDAACDAYDEQMSTGCEASVFRMEPPVNGAAGMMVDVTPDAIARIRSRLNDRRQEWPHWLEVAA